MLLHNRRIQQSGFTPGRSTTDRIATLNMLHQTRREFNWSLWVANVDLKAAFDNVDRNAVSDLFTSLGIPQDSQYVHGTLQRYYQLC